MKRGSGLRKGRNTNDKNISKILKPNIPDSNYLTRNFDLERNHDWLQKFGIQPFKLLGLSILLLFAYPFGIRVVLLILATFLAYNFHKQRSRSLNQENSEENAKSHSETEPSTVFCSGCESKIIPNSTFCTECGTNTN